MHDNKPTRTNQLAEEFANHIADEFKQLEDQDAVIANLITILAMRRADSRNVLLQDAENIHQERLRVEKSLDMYQQILSMKPEPKIQEYPEPEPELSHQHTTKHEY